MSARAWRVAESSSAAATCRLRRARDRDYWQHLSVRRHGRHLFAAGTAGERFAVRNSGATAVIEGAGDHCCEYMTGGVVVVLGRTGVNFGAGMTGGFAYVLDMDRDFVDRYNHELIDIHRITPESMEAHCTTFASMIVQHVEATGSAWARQILEDYRTFLPKFWLVKPKAAELGSLIESLRQAA